MSWSQKVYSSNVAEVGWDEPDQMTVSFNIGSRYIYSGVDEETATRLANAPSVGSMLNQEIKGQYAFRKA